MNLFYTLTNFIIGTCLASHAAVICERINTTDFIFSRSRCNYCHFELALLGEIPLLSFLYLKGHCRYCQQKIPVELFLFELIGGFAFEHIDFNQSRDLATTILLFSIFLVAISDYRQKEFDLILLTPAITITLLCHHFTAFNLFDWFILFFFSSILGWYVFKQKLGLGDLFIYLILAIYFDPTSANQILLIASVLLIITYIVENNPKDYSYPFIPFILLGLIIKQWLLD